jgi:hypothetical protein
VKLIASSRASETFDLEDFDRNEVECALSGAAERRFADPAVTDSERAAVRRMLG